MYFNEVITPDDIVRLGTNLNSWHHLNELLILDQFSLSDLKKLLILETEGKQRQQVLTNLCSKIKTKETKHVRTIIQLHTAPAVPDQTHHVPVRRHAKQSGKRQR